MNKISYGSLVCAVAVLAPMFTSCETTGDPNSGTIFWSPSKAMERRTSLLEAQASKQQELNSLQTKTSNYTSERNRLQQEKKKLEARKKADYSFQDRTDIDKAIDDIEAELENM